MSEVILNGNRLLTHHHVQRDKDKDYPARQSLSWRPSWHTQIMTMNMQSIMMTGILNAAKDNIYNNRSDDHKDHEDCKDNEVPWNGRKEVFLSVIRM